MSAGTSLGDLHLATDAACRWLLDRQHPQGYWVGELEGDSILESEFILLQAWLGREQSQVCGKCAAHLLKLQNAEGGWSSYPDGPIDISASVKAYFALKLTGCDIESEPLRRARSAILAAGGAEGINSFTRYFLALLGVLEYRQCPAVPPEIILLPAWSPFNIYEMSSWSRTILVPLSVLWANQPTRKLPKHLRIDELFRGAPAELPAAGNAFADAEGPWHWNRMFGGLDRAWKFTEQLGVKPLRALALEKAERWILDRLPHSDGLGAIFPPIVWAVVALRSLGYSIESREVQSQLVELEKLMIDDGVTIRLQPCQSPVWDTAIATLALRTAGVSQDERAITSACDWLLEKEVRTKGDWENRCPNTSAGGWFFEFENAFYPDIDDTIMVAMALDACRSSSNVARARRISDAIRRGTRWVSAMQCAGGGWAAFDKDNTRELYTKVPFADHNAMIDPPTADITARVLEMRGALGCDMQTVEVENALRFVSDQQEDDGSWFGRWGVNYIYGTWQSLLGLRACGVRSYDPRISRAVRWLEEHQQSNGAWGESPRSYDDPACAGRGEATASQTAWAVLGLIAAGRSEGDCVRRGIEWLLQTQMAEGDWREPQFTGTGFPRVFYLRYDLYRVSFPLMALARYRESLDRRDCKPRQTQHSSRGDIIGRDLK